MSQTHLSTNERRPVSGTSEHGDLLKVSRYDRAASMLISLLVMVGLLALVLVIIFVTNRVFTLPAQPEMYLVEEEGEDLSDMLDRLADKRIDGPHAPFPQRL